MHPILLEGPRFALWPLEREHFPALVEAAAFPELWENLPLDGTNPDELLTELKSALLKRTTGESYTFTVVEKSTGKLIGSTRYMDIQPLNKKLEIGFTWYTPAFWSSGVNKECKYLLLQYAFEVLQLNRVQLKTRDTNLRSRKAIASLGAKLEGVLRNDRVTRFGVRDTYLFSIIASEWPEVSRQLLEKISV